MAEKKVSKPRTLRIGIAGLGQAAASTLPEILSHPHIKLTAGADLRPEARDKFSTEFGGKVYQRVEDLCANPNVDAVYVATPHQFHAQHALMALDQGKHVLLEKPMALNLEDCDAMIQAAERHGVQLLVGRGSHGFDVPVYKMREIVRSGELGRLGMIHSWLYSDFLYQPRTPEELDTSLGGGVIFNQGPHQIDIIRVLTGGLIRSVRAMTGIWDPSRPSEGSFVAYLESIDGVPATIIYNGYDHFDTDEFHWWIGTYGQPKDPNHHGKARRSLRQMAKTPEEEAALKASYGYGGTRKRERLTLPEKAPAHHNHWGVMIVSCEKGDMRQSPDGILIYDDDGRREIPLPEPQERGSSVIAEFYDAAVNNRPLLRDGRWEKATLEVCLAILESARERREVFLSHQVSTRN